MKVNESWTDYSLLSDIFIDNVAHHHAGNFWCRPKPWSNNLTDQEESEEKLEFHLKVSDIVPASVDLSRTNLFGDTIDFRAGKNVTFKCPTNGNPVPSISWMKDGKPINFLSQVIISQLALVLPFLDLVNP
jgi:hypothetical protein